MTLFLILLSLLIPLASGVLLTILLLPKAQPAPAVCLFRVFAGGGLGLGISSCCQFVSLLIGSPRAIVAIDLLTCLILFLAVRVFRRRERAPAAEPRTETTGSWFDRLAASLFVLGLAGFLTSYAVTAVKEPHGRWDAWLIWNMHARFLYRGGAHWREVFASGLDWSHWDYPLLLPLSIVRGWTYAGQEELRLPVIMGFLFTFLTLGLLSSALWTLRDRSQGCLAALLLMGTPFFIFMGAAQFADIPLAFFLLMTLIMLVIGSRAGGDQPGAAVLAGLAAGLAAWTKNEGLLFFLVTAASLVLVKAWREGWKPSLRRALPFIAGALPVLWMVSIFKLSLSPASDLLAGLSPAALSAKLLAWDRYAQIARAFFLTGLSFTQGLIDIRVGMHLDLGAVNILLPVAYLLFVGICSDRRDRAGLFEVLIVLTLMMAGYFFVYVLTPLDLDYHLVTSLNRLYLQLWPGFLFLIFMTARVPDSLPSGGRTDVKPAPPSGSAAKEKRRRRNAH